MPDVENGHEGEDGGRGGIGFTSFSLNHPQYFSFSPLPAIGIQFHRTIIGEDAEEDCNSFPPSNYYRSHWKYPPRTHLHLDASEERDSHTLAVSGRKQHPLQ